MTALEYLRTNAPKWYVVLLRIFMGAFYLRVAALALRAVNADAATAKGALTAMESARQFPWFQEYVMRVVDPVRGSAFLPALWVAVPGVLGLMLVLGIYTRTASVVAAILVAHAWLLRFHSAGAAELMFLELQFAALVVLCAAAAGRAWGIDAIFWRHRVLATHEGGPDVRYVEPRLPIIRDIEPIELSETKPGATLDAKPEEKK